MKIWRTLWIGKEITSVEMVAPDIERAAQKMAARSGMSDAELQAHLATQGVDGLRAALVRCIDMPDKQQGHACFVEADDVPSAFVVAKGKHPDWTPS